MKTIERYGPNEKGKDFIVSDIHGCFNDLEEILDDNNFCTQTDRLFSVGDLVDRGPHSPEAVWWYSQPWFHAVIGNHELFLHENIRLNGTDPQVDQLWAINGGGWWAETTSHVRNALANIIEDLPYMIEIAGDDFRFGIVHAEVPCGFSWDNLVNHVDENDVAIIDQITWGRDRIGSKEEIIEDLDYAFAGHTILKAPRLLGNHWFIDTGSFMPYFGHHGYGIQLLELETQ